MKSFKQFLSEEETGAVTNPAPAQPPSGTPTASPSNSSTVGATGSGVITPEMQAAFDKERAQGIQGKEGTPIIPPPSSPKATKYISPEEEQRKEEPRMAGMTKDKLGTTSTFLKYK